MDSYEEPQVTDLGDLTAMTLATGSIGAEDGVGKTITAEVDGVARVSVGLLP